MLDSKGLAHKFNKTETIHHTMSVFSIEHEVIIYTYIIHIIIPTKKIDMFYL